MYYLLFRAIRQFKESLKEDKQRARDIKTEGTAHREFLRELDTGYDTPFDQRLRACTQYIDRIAGLPIPKHQLVPIPMILHCWSCGAKHIDKPDGDWKNPPHRSHLCHSCGFVWRPADVPTTGVPFVHSFGRNDTFPSSFFVGDIPNAEYR